MRILVAGAGGLVGSAVAKAYSKKNYDVITTNRSELDFFNLEATTSYFLDLKPDIVIDAAARVGGIYANDAYPVDFLLQNLKIQQNLMGAAHVAGVEKFVFLGSSCVYPRKCAQPIKEEYLMTGHLEATNSAYAIAKIAGIELLNSYRKQYGRNWISLMPTNVYGWNDNFNLENSHVLPALIRRFVEATEQGASAVTLWGTGAPFREFLFADDLAEAVIIATDKYDSPLHLNIGTGEELSIRDLAESVATLAGFTGNINWDTTKPDGTPRKVLDVSRIKALGWKPATTLHEGIASTIAWYKQARMRGEVRE